MPYHKLFIYLNKNTLIKPTSPIKKQQLMNNIFSGTVNNKMFGLEPRACQPDMVALTVQSQICGYLFSSSSLDRVCLTQNQPSSLPYTNSVSYVLSLPKRQAQWQHHGQGNPE